MAPLPRYQEQHLQTAIASYPAVALLGPRQVGKTTLAKKMARIHQALYLDLESPTDLLKFDDPLSFLSSHRDQLVVLDEIHRLPEVFKTLRRWHPFLQNKPYIITPWKRGDRRGQYQV